MRKLLPLLLIAMAAIGESNPTPPTRWVKGEREGIWFLEEVGNHTRLAEVFRDGSGYWVSDLRFNSPRTLALKRSFTDAKAEAESKVLSK